MLVCVQRVNRAITKGNVEKQDIQIYLKLKNNIVRNKSYHLSRFLDSFLASNDNTVAIAVKTLYSNEC